MNTFIQLDYLENNHKCFKTKIKVAKMFTISSVFLDGSDEGLELMNFAGIVHSLWKCCVIIYMLIR